MSAHPPDLTMQSYLGDGAYVGHDGYHVVLYTSDGIEHSRPVYLEPSALGAFLQWVDRNIKRQVPE